MRYQTNIKLYPRSASISGQRVDLVKDENYFKRSDQSDWGNGFGAFTIG